MKAADLVEKLHRWREILGFAQGRDVESIKAIDVVERELLEAELDALRERAAEDRTSARASQIASDPTRNLEPGRGAEEPGISRGAA
jgi:hypothetical protein